MENVFVSLFVSLLAGLIILLIDHWVIQPQKDKQNRKTTNDKWVQSDLRKAGTLSAEAITPEFISYYHKLAIALVGVLSGIAFGIFLIEWLKIPTDENWFLIPVFIVAVGGGAVAGVIDSTAWKSEISFQLRLLTALIFGFFGSIVVLAGIIIAVAALIIYFLIIESRD